MMKITGCCDRLTSSALADSARYNRWMVRNRRGAVMIAACIVFLSCAPSRLNAQALPAAPSMVSENPGVHRFWDRENILLFSGVAVFRGLDYASTRNFMARGREEILIPDDIVNNSAAFASLEAAATATSVGLSYLMHRTSHHKLERWVSITHISVTGFGVVRNYSLQSKHSAP
jgi:hypothetical protein